MESSDATCVARCLGGDGGAFRLLVQRYQRLVFAHLGQRLRDPDALEEAAQEAFVRAFAGLATLRKPESFYAWLLGIAERVALESLRGPVGIPLDPVFLEAWVEAPEPEPTPSLEAALATLPEASRRLIQMRYYEGLTCQEVADLLSLPLGTVTKTLSRAFAQLRQVLKEGAEPALKTPNAQRSRHGLS